MSADRRLVVGLPDLSPFGVVGDLVTLLDLRRPDVSPAARVWVAVAVTGACLGTRVVAKPWGRPMRPNLYVLLVTPSGVGKGDLFGDAEDIYDLADPGNLLPDRFSAAGLADVFKERDHGLMVIDEGGELFRRTRQDAFADTVGMLCRAYDGRVTRESLRTRPQTGTSPLAIAPTMLMAIQPSALQEGVIDSRHMLSGLIARMVVIAVERPPSRVLLNEPTPAGAAAQDCVVAGLRSLHRVEGEMHLSEGATDRLAHLKARIEAERPAEELDGTWARVEALAVKVALILQAGVGGADATPLIGDQAMAAATQLAAWSWTEAKRLFSTRVAFSRTDGDLQGLLRTLRALGGQDVSRSQVLREMRGTTAAQLDVLVRTLVEREQLVVRDGPTGPRGGRRPSLMSVTE